MEISLKIKQIKNIRSADVTFPFAKGLYAIVGENGCGKSTLMLSMSLMVKTSSAHMLAEGDICPDSIIDISVNGQNDHWYFNPKRHELTTGKFHKHNGKLV